MLDPCPSSAGVNLQVESMRHPLSMAWILWVEVGRDDFDAYVRTWDNAAERQALSPMEGVLANHIPVYHNTLGLPVKVWLQEPGTRPMLSIESGTHRLRREQSHGVSPKQAMSRCDALLLRCWLVDDPLRS